MGGVFFSEAQLENGNKNRYHWSSLQLYRTTHASAPNTEPTPVKGVSTIIALCHGELGDISLDIFHS